MRQTFAEHLIDKIVNISQLGFVITKSCRKVAILARERANAPGLLYFTSAEAEMSLQVVTLSSTLQDVMELFKRNAANSHFHVRLTGCASEAPSNEKAFAPLELRR